jgi:hypothetical protein
MQRTVEIEGVEYAAGVPENVSHEVIALDDGEDENTEDQPNGALYYADAFDAETIAWTLKYAADHPEDEYIRNKAERLRQIKEKGAFPALLSADNSRDG